MGRTEKLTVYVSESDRNRIEREAESQGVSVSSYFMQAVERQWERDDVEAAADQLAVEEKVEQIVADARDELLGIARSVERRNDDVADMTARAGTYSIANFELMKDEFDPAESRKAESLLIGSRRLRQPIDEHPDRDLDAEEDEEEEHAEHLDEYGLDPEDEYYNIKREEAQYEEMSYLFGDRDPATEREAEYLQGIDKTERTSEQQERLEQFDRRKRKERQWRAERSKIQEKARHEYEKVKEERNSGLGRLFWK
jgi:hypothetical protein